MYLFTHLKPLKLIEINELVKAAHTSLLPNHYLGSVSSASIYNVGNILYLIHSPTMYKDDNNTA